MSEVPVLTTRIRSEQDVVRARQRAMEIAVLLEFAPLDQTRIATAVSEMARNAWRYGGGGAVEFLIDTSAPAFLARVCDQGPGIPDLQAVLDGAYLSRTGMGMGIAGSRLLMDRFEIESSPEGTTVLLGKMLPPQSRSLTRSQIRSISDRLARQPVEDPVQVLEQQERELLVTLAELRSRQADVERLNEELEDTNRGVMALYSELDEKADYLQRVNAQKSRFFSNMSHEFRTPLNAILSLSRLLLDRIDGELTPEQEKQVSFIRKSAEGLSELVNDLLDMAKAEAGKLTIRPSSFTVPGLFGTVRGMLRPVLGSASVDLIFDEPSGVPPLHTDENKVSQILRNLISNALKFTEDGYVRVSASAGSGDTIIFNVTDTGVGIPPEEQERIFEEFAQIEGPLQQRTRGTGLGLPLSRKLAELMGGTLTVQSQPGAGSTFSLRIPRLYSGPAAVAYVPETGWQLDPSRIPVLILCNDREQFFTYEASLRGSGFQPLIARSAQEARRALRDIHPDAVIVHSPDGDAETADAVAELKSDSRTRDVPLLLSGDYPSQARSSGAEVLRLPFERDDLISALERLVRRERREKLLAIDDDVVSRYLVRRLLSDTRYLFLEAAGGREGLVCARRERPDVILLDLAMPDMSGVQVLDALEEDASLREIPVIVITGLPLGEDEREELEARVSSVLLKDSLAREALIAAVRGALERPAPELEFRSA